MTTVQWLLLVLVIVAVAGIYWYLRHQADSDPWRDMEEPTVDDEDAEDASPETRGESLGGDSYIVGVRTLSRETPAGRKAAARGQEDDQDAADTTDATADASWQAYKQLAGETEAEPRRAADSAPARPEPEIRPEPEPEPKPTSERVEMSARLPPEGEQEIFILHVASPDGRFFDGPDIHAVLKAQDLKFGLNDVYHRVTEVHGVTESVFAVANMLKPGTLDPMDQDHLSTPGLILFLVVPCPLDGTRAMRDMMETANAIAAALGGEVLDDKRALLKAQTAQYMLDRLAELDRQAQLASRR